MTTIRSIDELWSYTDSLLSQRYRYFCLEGQLGAGKTTFVKQIVSWLWGDADLVQSPTYTYLNTYQTPQWTVVHIDMYRLEDEDNARRKWIFDAIDEGDIICIERPKRTSLYTDSDRIRLQFVLHDDGSRTIERIR